MPDELSLERIIPDRLDELDSFDQTTLQLHIERYDFAIQNGQPGRILDIACGVGYGSARIIGDDRFKNCLITAVDISTAAIEYGIKRYGSDSIEFVCSDVMEFSSPSPFDTIVCLETIEHLKDPKAFTGKLYTLLKKGGTLILSAPVTPSTDGNPYHMSDFTSAGLRKLLKRTGFEEFSNLKQVQPFTVSRVFNNKNKRLEQTGNRIWAFYLRHPLVIFKRIFSLIRNGLTNKYLTLALRKV